MTNYFRGINLIIIIHMKQETQFSLFRALNTTQPPTSITLGEVYRLITSDPALKENTEKYRYFRSQGYQADADKIKRSQSPAFTPAAVFDTKRTYKALKQWTGYTLVDIDKLTEQQVHRMVEQLRADPYWLLVYITLSGKGLRIILRVDKITDRTTYQKAFYQANEHYCRLFGIADFDTAVKDATRTSVICHDAGALYREDAETFPLDENLVTPGEVWPLVENRLKGQGYAYETGRHNEYIAQTGYLMNRYGVTETDATDWAKRRFPDYDPTRIESHIRSCYTTRTEEHGAYGKKAVSKPKKKKRGEDTVTIEQLEAFISSVADIRFNVITRRNEIRWKDCPSPKHGNLTDKDECTLWRMISKQYGMVKLNHIVQIIASDFVPSFHPFKDYFDRLPEWKPGDTDHLQLLADTVTLVDNSGEARALFTHCLRKWMVAMVAGFLTDKVNHEVLVFVGKQGIYKTTWFQYLLPEELRDYFVPKVNSRRMNKDERLLLAEAGLICLEEIVSMTDEEIDQIKAVVTLPHVVERAAYARNKEVRPHIASFCGTGNQINFLTDDDNRRWLPFEVENILSPYEHPINYSCLYAQLKHLWQSGFVYWFDQNEIRRLRHHSSHFEAPCLEEELILNFYRKPKPGEQGVFVATAEILSKINAGLKHKLNPNKIGSIMKSLGMEKVRSKNGGRGYRVYEYTFDEIKANKLCISAPEQAKLEF